MWKFLLDSHITNESTLQPNIYKMEKPTKATAATYLKNKDF